MRVFDYPGLGTDSEPAFAACLSLDGSRCLTLAPGGGVITQPGNLVPLTAILTDASGGIVAQRQFYSPDGNSDIAAQAFPTTDGGWITYSQIFRYDTFHINFGAVLRKLRADLTPVWEKIVSLPGYSISVLTFSASPTLALTADGGFLLSGQLKGIYYGSVLGGYDLGSENNDVVLLKLDASGTLQAAYQVGGLASDTTDGRFGGIGEDPGGGPIGYPHATQTTDGGFIFTTPTFSYVTPANTMDANPDWLTVKLDPNGRLHGFSDILASLPLSLFSVVDNTAASVDGGNFADPGSGPDYPAKGYAGVTSDPTPTFVAGAFSGSGDDRPNQQFPAGLFTGPVLPPTTNFVALASFGAQAGTPFAFTASQADTASGLTVRVQASTTPLVEGSWADVSGGVMRSVGQGNWTVTTNSAPVSDNASRPYFYRAVAAATGYHDGVSMFGLATAHPPFFAGESALGNGVYYLSFPSGNYFGYYSYLSDSHYLFHFDLGYEYAFDAADGRSGVYLYDFTSGTFFYSSPAFPFPYLYDFSLNTVLYYYPSPTEAGHYNTNGFRFFYRFDNGQIFVK